MTLAVYLQAPSLFISSQLSYNSSRLYTYFLFFSGEVVFVAIGMLKECGFFTRYEFF